MPKTNKIKTWEFDSTKMYLISSTLFSNIEDFDEDEKLLIAYPIDGITNTASNRRLLEDEIVNAHAETHNIELTVNKVSMVSVLNIYIFSCSAEHQPDCLK